MFAPDLSAANIVVLPFHEIMPAVCSGRVDAGVIIHESRFTYQRYGLVRIVDLGEWWELETGQAIPLGGIAMRRDLGDDLIQRSERALAASVDHAYAHPEHVWPTIRRHAQEMEDEVMRQHIALYVNDFTRDYGAEGTSAIHFLLDRARALGIVPLSNEPLFATT
jgi:1,4-dihydroxy-6-naphthoate synthase